MYVCARFSSQVKFQVDEDLGSRLVSRYCPSRECAADYDNIRHASRLPFRGSPLEERKSWIILDPRGPSFRIAHMKSIRPRNTRGCFQVLRYATLEIIQI